MKALLLIDHGSVRPEANAMLECMANLVQHMVGDQASVHFAHMELASPTIEDGCEACVRAGATEVVVFPYMLSPGRHSTTDIPRMVEAAARAHPGVTFTVTDAFGVEAPLAEVILRRAGMKAARSPDPESVRKRCWNPACEKGGAGSCGDACPEFHRGARRSTKGDNAPASGAATASNAGAVS